MEPRDNTPTNLDLILIRDELNELIIDFGYEMVKLNRVRFWNIELTDNISLN